MRSTGLALFGGLNRAGSGGNILYLTLKGVTMDNENSKPRQNRWAKSVRHAIGPKRKTYQNTVRKRLLRCLKKESLLKGL